jgi:hypothetical protein
MPSLALVYGQADIAFAEQLAQHLSRKGWELTTSSALSIATTTAGPRQLIHTATHGVLVLLSRAFVTSQPDLPVHKLLVEACQADDINIYPISIDAAWQAPH